MRGTIFVVTQSKFRAEARLERGKGGEGDSLSPAVAHIELANVFHPGAVLTLGFDIDLPLAAEAIEIVDEITAHKCLDGAVDIAQIHALLQHLVAIYLDKFLGNIGQESGTKTGDFGALSSGGKKEVQVSGEELDIASRTVLEHEGETAGSADAGNGRRGKTEGNPRRQLAQLAG